MAKVLVVGDLHLSDKTYGRHRDYWKNCIDVCTRITNMLKEQKITHLVLAGDLIGLKVKLIKERVNLALVISILDQWNALTGGNVYAIAGNHDSDGFKTDFDFFVMLHKVKRVKYFDVDSLRVHLFDYGKEKEVPELRKGENVSNVAVMHNTFTIEGKTDWMRYVHGFELSGLKNLKGIEVVVAGDYHVPSPSIMDTSIDDVPISLIYPGCPTRPTWTNNMWDFCWGIVFDVDGESVNMDMLKIKLRPFTEIFNLDVENPNDLQDESMDELHSMVDIDALISVFADMEKYTKVDSGASYFEQVDKFASLDKEAAKVAKEYIADAGYEV